MKMSLLCILVSLSSFVISAQSVGSMPDDLATAIGSGNVSAISTYLADRVELTIGSSESVLPKADAQKRLQAFYSSNQAKGFKAMHAGNSKSQDSNYSIGSLTTDNGSYRVYVYYTKQGNRLIVSELRFEQ